MLSDIVDAVGGQVEIILDGGIRRGTHLLKAIALGANACMIGRPYLYGLAAGGQPGVARALSLLRTEIELDMKLMGCRNLSEVTSALPYANDSDVSDSFPLSLLILTPF